MSGLSTSILAAGDKVLTENGAVSINDNECKWLGFLGR